MRHHFKLGLGLLALAAVSSVASAGLISSQYSNGNEVTFANGGGSGFGGTLGNGSIKMNLTGGNLVVTLTPGGSLNDNVAIFLDTKAGGFLDNQMNDQNDGGRRAVTSPAANGNINFPTDALPDYGLTIGNFGSVLFQLSSDPLIPFVQFNAAQTISIPLSSIGNPSTINFFALYTSDSTFMSNETLPADPGINAGGNPGFDAVNLTVSNYNQVTSVAVPEPAAVSLLGLPALLLGRRTRRN